MRKHLILFACPLLALVTLPAAWCQDSRPNLSGTWQLDAAKSDMKTVKIADATWVIKEGDNTIHITESENGRAKAVELQCSTDGKECQVTGDKAKASFWYNGPMLVEMETKGDHVTRYRMKLSSDGKTLTIETTHIVPQDDRNDVLVFAKHS